MIEHNIFITPFTPIRYKGYFIAKNLTLSDSWVSDTGRVMIDATPVKNKTYIVVDANDDIGNYIEFSDIYIHVIQQNVEVVNFYFTSLGKTESKNSLLKQGSGFALYDAEGNLINDSSYDGVGVLTFTQSNGNMIKASYNDFIVESNNHLVMKPNTTYEAVSVQVEDRSLIPLCGTLTSTSSTTVKVKELPCGVLVKSLDLLLALRS